MQRLFLQMYKMQQFYTQGFQQECGYQAAMVQALLFDWQVGECTDLIGEDSDVLVEGV